MKTACQNKNLMQNTAWACGLILIGALLSAGCAAPVVKEPVAFSKIPESEIMLDATPEQRIYTLQIGDLLDVKFYNNGALNETIIVRPDGKISIQPIGEMQAEGLTPLQLERRMEKKFQQLLPEKEKERIKQSGRKFSRPKYYLRIGDLIEIKFYKNSELNQVAVVRPDGKISLEPIGEIQAEWRTPEEVRIALENEFKKHLTDPIVTVIVREFTTPEVYQGGEITLIVRKYATPMVYVGGEITDPGVIPLDYRKEISALEAVIRRGGFKRSADPRSIVILRKSGGENPEFYIIDLKDHLRLARNQDIILKPYDIVFVPRSRISNMIEFMEQYFDELIPVMKTVGLGFNYDLNPDDTVKVR